MESDQKDEEKISKIKKIIEREIEKEIVSKQDEVMEITEKIEKVMRNLDILKYVVTVNYYENNSTIGPKKVGDQEDDSKDEKVQSQIHPCVKRLLPFRSNYVKSFGGDGSHSYETRKSRQSMAMGETSSTVTKEEELTKAEEEVTKLPQYIPPLPNPDAVKEVINSQRGSSSKVKHRIIIGNISKWIPPDTREDKSTHKWMVYVRNQDKEKDDAMRHIRKVRYFLHESYKPHDIIDVTSAPFHLTRRGWGEFPIRVQLHFRHPLNKPVDIIHNLKLDMTCSGVQTLGSETVVEVCLHESLSSNKATQSKRSVRESEYANGKKTMERTDVFDGTLLMPVNGIKSELTSEEDRADGEDSAEASGDGKSETTQPSLITNNSNLILDRRKLLEVIEREHDYCKVEGEPRPSSESSILRLINGDLYRNGVVPRQVARKGTSLIEVSMSRGENEVFRHLKSVASNVDGVTAQSKYCMKTFKQSYLINVIQRVHATRLRTVEALLKWFFRRWPIVTKLASDPTYRHIHPYSCPSEEEFFQYNIGKQRSAEWFRAKAIQKLLISLKPLLPIDEVIWTTKQILTWSRFHGYSPISCPPKPSLPQSGDTSEGESSKRLSDSDTEPDEPAEDSCPRKGKSKFTVNGLRLGTDRKRNFKRGRKKSLTSAKSYRHASAYSEPEDATRFGALDYRVMERRKAPEIDVVTIVDEEEDNSKKGTPVSDLKRREAALTVVTAPPDEVAMNRYVAGATRQIGIRLANEEVVPGVMCDSVVRVMSQAAVTFVDELLRRSLAQAWMRNNDRAPSSLEYDDVLATLMETPQFDVFTNRGLGIQPAIKMEQ